MLNATRICVLVMIERGSLIQRADWLYHERVQTLLLELVRIELLFLHRCRAARRAL